MRRYLVLSLLGILALLPSAFAAAPLPTWSVNDYFQVSQVVSATGDMTQAQFQFTLNVSAARWTVEAITTKTLPHCGSAEVYVLSFDGISMAGTGHATITDPIAFDADLELRDGTASGEMWIRTDDLNPAAYTLDASASAWAFLFGNWVDVGSATITGLTLEFCPFMEDFQWPLEVGMTWSSTINIYITGHIEANLMLFGIPYDLIYDINEEQAFSFGGGCTGMQDMNGCNSYKVDLNNSGGDGTMSNFYCPNQNIQWYSKKTLTDFYFEDPEGGGGISVSELSWNVTDGYHASTGETPTPTPTGGTPTTPTVTPTPAQGEVYVDLELSASMFHPGDAFILNMIVQNYLSTTLAADTYILLQVFDQYFSYPTWGNIDAGLTFENRSYSYGINTLNVFTFDWPSGAGTLTEGLYFYAALFEPGTLDVATVIGNIPAISFGFMEP